MEIWNGIGYEMRCKRKRLTAIPCLCRCFRRRCEVVVSIIKIDEMEIEVDRDSVKDRHEHSRDLLVPLHVPTHGLEVGRHVPAVLHDACHDAWLGSVRHCGITNL